MSATDMNSMNGAFYTATQEVANAAGHAHTLDATDVIIIGHHDFSVDGLASMLEAADGNYHISCLDPDFTQLPKPGSDAPDVVLIQNEILEEPLERFIAVVSTAYPRARILVFGKNMDDDYLYRLVRAGVQGYINERMSGDDIKRALDNVMAGNNWVERHILERFVATQKDLDTALELQCHRKIEQMCSNLTKRETEILCQVVKGLAIKQIAEQVHLSHQGVKMHLAKLFKKFGVSNRNQLILAAFDRMSPVEDLSELLHNGLRDSYRSQKAEIGL